MPTRSKPARQKPPTAKPPTAKLPTAKPQRDRIHVYLDRTTAEALAQYARACERTASKAAGVLIREGLSRPWPAVPPITALPETVNE